MSELAQMIAAAEAGHCILLLTTPKSEKRIGPLARALRDALPPPTAAERRAIEMVYADQDMGYTGLPRPLRAPHHTVSAAAMTGSPRNPRFMGELALAHAGVLLLAELPSFMPYVVSEIARVLAEGRSGKYPAVPAVIVASCPLKMAKTCLASERSAVCSTQWTAIHVRVMKDTWP